MKVAVIRMAAPSCLDKWEKKWGSTGMSRDEVMHMAEAMFAALNQNSYKQGGWSIGISLSFSLQSLYDLVVAESIEKVLRESRSEGSIDEPVHFLYLLAIWR